jgi:hypothetical protein
MSAALRLAEAPRSPALAQRIETSLAAIAGTGPLAARHRQQLQQWHAILEGRPIVSIEALRTLHHFACTGGTLISKCIAALPNVQLLSEVDPLSPYQADGAPRFAPTDMVTLLRQSSRGADTALITQLFQVQVRWLYDDAVRRGWRLVLRDHAHSHFCQGAEVAERPNLRQLMPAGVPLRSLVTVRHPLDSYASLVGNDWLHFEPRNFDTYCRRYLMFLDSHAGVPVLRYEDFVAAPQATMQQLCDILELRYEPGFAERMQGQRISGDSGRSGTIIAARRRSARAEALRAEAGASGACVQLIERLGYTL